jgi:ATP synthase protein I
MVRAPFCTVPAIFALHTALLGIRYGMAEDDPDARRLAQLEERLKKARGTESVVRPQQALPQSSNRLGIAFRLVSELVAGVIVGGGIGWALDHVFRTSPLLLIVMFLLGVAAGVMNVVRTARQMDEEGRAKGG